MRSSDVVCACCHRLRTKDRNYETKAAKAANQTELFS